jgi:choline dehydrogenase
LDQPTINLNFFGDDILMNGEAMKDLVEGDYPWPMPRASDEAMNRAILERSQMVFHPCGTNRLSKDIKQGVVDPGMKVYGVNSLRVVNASVSPLIPDCRIQNVVYMVVEKFVLRLSSALSHTPLSAYGVMTDEWLQGADAIKVDHPDLYK